MSIINEGEVRDNARGEPTAKGYGYNIETNESLSAGKKIHHGLHADYAKRMDWEWVIENYAKTNKIKLRNVAMLVLYESLGLKTPVIAAMFDLAKGNVVRGIHRARVDLFKITRALADPKDLE